MTLAALLAERGIDRALIIDDGYDVVPRAVDLTDDRDAWANFIADLSLYHDAVEAAYPGYDQFGTDDLIRSDAFVGALWNAKGTLPGEAWEELFGRYERDEASDGAFLAELERELRLLGLAVNRAGRNTAIEDKMVPLVFVDLFLGRAQDDDALADSIARVREITARREDDPPLVVLMSRSDRLDLNKERFRRSTGLLGAMFRVSSKRALLEGGMLARILIRLAQHRADARRLAVLLNAWDRGLDEARVRFMEKVRKLDLPDYAQIRDLLVAFEGQPLGSYLLDVFDRVLQYEIEAERATILAAREVNEVDLSRYLAPHIAGSPDLQDLVHRTIYQNPERLAVPSTVSGIPLSFGDVLAEAAPLDAGEDLLEHQVFAVMSPACDLVRAGCGNVMLLAGTLKRLTPDQWSYGAGGARTPVLILQGDRRYWISWNLRDVRTKAAEEVGRMLNDHRPLMRLREGPALELQQRMLAHLGRIGQLAQLPATFPIAVELHAVDAHGEWRQVPLPSLDRDGGVCFVGRDEASKQNVRLVLSEAACDDIMSHIAALAEADVPSDAAQGLARLHAAVDLSRQLEDGLDVSAVKQAYAQAKAPRRDEEEAQPVLPVHIARNPEGVPARQAQRHGVIALVLRDLPTATNGRGGTAPQEGYT